MSKRTFEEGLYIQMFKHSTNSVLNLSCNDPDCGATKIEAHGMKGDHKKKERFARKSKIQYEIPRPKQFVEGCDSEIWIGKVEAFFVGCLLGQNHKIHLFFSLLDYNNSKLISSWNPTTFGECIQTFKECNFKTLDHSNLLADFHLKEEQTVVIYKGMDQTEMESVIVSVFVSDITSSKINNHLGENTLLLLKQAVDQAKHLSHIYSGEKSYQIKAIRNKEENHNLRRELEELNERISKIEMSTNKIHTERNGNMSQNLESYNVTNVDEWDIFESTCNGKCAINGHIINILGDSDAQLVLSLPLLEKFLMELELNSYLKIEESLLCKRKYHVRRIFANKQLWIEGGIDETGQIFM
ncbi:hypothetical protein RF11_06854 [Thelohanellus kitauei]|uniref:Uncharacterized protein n=1 Tax=Thelohanellus kitauei TaxID=669202 RepID=A0A0C2MCU5_THEKT|nr:hypothetical protein RF11_06854 [Thelohanellus kitauei]